MTIRPQHYQFGTSAPLNYQTGSSSNPGDNPTNPVVPDLDDVTETEKTRAELPKLLEDRCRWLEEKFRAMENADCHGRIDANDLSLVPNLVLPPKFKTLEFEKYNGTNITPDRLTLQSMEKKQNEGFRQYAQRWRDVATQVQPPLLEKETMMLFINTLKAPFINHMLRSTTKSFSDIVMSSEMIENTPITVGPPKTMTTNFQAPPRQESHPRLSTEKLQFTSIPMTYKELYQSLFDAYVVSHFYLKPMQPSYPKWYDTNAQCEYHAGITGHSIENCTAFKKLVERFIKMGIVKVDDQSSAENSLPNHADKGLEFFEYVKEVEVCTFEGGSIKRVCEANHPVVIISRPRSNEAGVQVAPRVIIQKPIAFPYKDSKKVPWNYGCNVIISGEEGLTGASEEGREVGFYTHSGKRYAGAEPVKGKTPIAKQEGEKTVKFNSSVNEPVTENEAREFLNFLKHSEYSVVE
ncbi:hypothetical protein EPI10_032438 [Gossypium australe]|uniref:Retrotransposon gag domain-containing protein n=1 Tax=Gossypium australe TaxID=47621 RepID=A0A5B6X6D4_9ROSI|nr:hypothetical protein EPI10_032438 [Gossypium australe]